MSNITDYNSALAVLDAGRTAPSRASRKVARNTYLIRREDGDIALRLHATDIVIYHADGSISLDSGGWQTMTTKARMEEFTPLRVDSIKGSWFVTGGYDCWDIDDTVRYFDGIRIAPNGALLNASPVDLEAMAARDAETKKLISRYLKGLTPAVLDELVTNAVENGLGGDCWFCSMFGDAGGNEHLRDHLEEPYYMISLMLNALKERGYSNPSLIIQMGMLDSIKRALRRYFIARLTENSGGRRPKAALSGVTYGSAA